MEDRIRAANGLVSIYDLLRERGQVVPSDRPRKILCPVHDDRHKSAQAYPSTNSLYCWTCSQAFDPVGLLVAEGMSYVEACSWIESRAGVVYERIDRPEDDFWRMARRAQSDRDGAAVSDSERFRYRWAVHQTVLEVSRALGLEVDWSGFDEAHLDVDALQRWRSSVLGLTRAGGHATVASGNEELGVRS